MGTVVSRPGEAVSLPRVLAGQVENFCSRMAKNTQIARWFEVANKLFDFGRLGIEFDVPEAILLHLIANAYVTSSMLVYEGYAFHAYAIARIGLDAFFQLAIIESNPSSNADVWRRYQTATQGSKEFNSVRSQFREVFEAEREHKLRRMIEPELAQELVRRWGFLSYAGSHANAIQSVFSTRIREDNGWLRLDSGIFDLTSMSESEQTGVLVFILDTFLIIRVATSQILTRSHDGCSTECENIRKVWRKWLAFKKETADRLGITLPSGT